MFFYFFVAGIATVMLGPLLPSLISRWHIQDAQAGTLFTASFAGQLCGAWFATRNLRVSVLYGAFLTAAGCACMAWTGFGTARVALFCIGLGLGAGLTAGNVIVGTAIPAVRTRLLALLNVTWGGGAITCTLLVRACGPGRVTLFFLVLSGFLALGAFFALAIPHAVSRAVPETVPLTRNAKDHLPLPIIPLLMFSAALVLYIGVENTLGGWLPSYAVRNTATLLASSVAMYFWIAELGSRLLLAALTSWLGETILYRMSVTLLILVEVTLMTVAHLSAAEVITLTILSGFALAPIYPLIVSTLLARTGSHPRLGPLFASASIGGAALPWLTGVLSTHFRELRAGFIVPAAGAAFLLVLSLGVKRRGVDTRFEEMQVK